MLVAPGAASQGGRDAGSGSKEYRGLLPHMSDDPLAFFHALEKCLELNQVAKADWPKLMPPLLNAKAVRCYSQMTINDCKNYDLVKQTVLASFRLTSATYLQRFRSVTRSGAENYKMFSNRLDGLFSYYLDSKEITEFQPLRDDIVLQQFLISLPPSVKSFVDARTPSSLSSTSELADLCFEITQSGNNSKFGAGRNNQNYTAKTNINSDAVAAEAHKGANAKGE